jgi:Xaa-Pro aminopeptidase
MAKRNKPATTSIISKREFERRRRELMLQMEPDSIAILPSANTLIRNRDAEFKFRQDSDFHYLSGFNEPDSVLVLVPGRKHGQCLFFCRERNPERELWDGYREGPEGLCEHFGADDAFPITDIDDILPGLMEGRERVYYSMGKRPEFDKQVMDWVNVLRSKARSGAHPPGEFLDLDHLLHDMRLYKSAAELRVMKEAADISAAAHTRAMKFCQPGMMEYQLEAEYLHEFAASGAQAAAYNSIVGGGKNACVLHYGENNAMLRDGDLVLVDAGCELNCYASDITRTYPVNGRFSKEQQALYEIVLDAQIAAIETIKPGSHWNHSHDETVRVITQGLLNLNILQGDLETLIETEAYRPFYMHRAGHWIGMDVHDVGDYKVHDEWRVLEAGMVMTVEPGIYIAADNKNVAAKWRGIGIRIEDDVAVTANGYEILSSDVVKSVSDIHRLMRPSSSSVSADPAQIDFIGGTDQGESFNKKSVKTVAKGAAKKSAPKKGTAKKRTQKAPKKAVKKVVKKAVKKTAKKAIKKVIKKVIKTADKKVVLKKKAIVKKSAVKKKVAVKKVAVKKAAKKSVKKIVKKKAVIKKKSVKKSVAKKSTAKKLVVKNKAIKKKAIKKKSAKKVVLKKKIAKKNITKKKTATKKLVPKKLAKKKTVKKKSTLSKKRSAK